MARKGIVESNDRVDPAPNHGLSDEERPVPAAKQHLAAPRRLRKLAAFGDHAPDRPAALFDVPCQGSEKWAERRANEQE
jgi:hypothetical protein